MTSDRDASLLTRYFKILLLLILLLWAVPQILIPAEFLNAVSTVASLDITVRYDTNSNMTIVLVKNNGPMDIIGLALDIDGNRLSYFPSTPLRKGDIWTIPLKGYVYPTTLWIYIEGMENPLRRDLTPRGKFLLPLPNI